MMMMISQPEKNIFKLDIVRVLTRDKASPAHLRGRRPPSLVSDQRHPHSHHHNSHYQHQSTIMVMFTETSPLIIPIINNYHLDHHGDVHHHLNHQPW